MPIEHSDPAPSWTKDMSRKNLPKLIEDLRSYQAELLAQNTALQYGRIAAEGASERFESLFSNVPLALMVVDEFGMVVQSNAMALQLFRPREQDPPLNFLMPLIGADHTARVEHAFAVAKKEGQSDTSEVTFSRGTAGSFTGDLHIARIEYSQDDLPHFVCAIIDQGPLLTERRALNERRRALQESAAALQQRNEELRLSQNRLAAIINSSLDAIVCVDNSQRISVFNPAAAALFHCPPGQALNTSLSRFLPDAIEAIAATQVSSHATLGEVNGQTADGKTLALEVSVSCEHHPEGDITTVFARDLTARKQVEAHRNMLESQLRESHKMQAIGTMAGGIAHDFNNILTAILGNVELAKQDAGATSPAQVSLTEIDKAGRRARDLVRQILTFSRNESPKRSPIQLADVVQETARLLRVTLPPTAELQLRLKETPDVLADATQVEQALINLCTNAIQAIGSAKGTVSIELDSDHPDPLECERLGIEAGHYVILSVRDTGSGMEAETLQRIFEPFFTTKPVGQGTGLGLAVVHGVMRTHLGTVDVSSIPGSGSVFTLYFPAAGSDVVHVAVEPPKPEVIKGHGKRVMYVDDDQALVFLIERALSRRGFNVSVFTDPRQAIAVLRACPDDFDLLVTDYNMPGFSGVELLLEARQIRPDLPVALASGYVTPEIERDALAAGARALIHKPNDVGDLCDTVQRLIQGDAAA
jgi:two-component system, cell cycle sensor histidine kinase and response regulator CckA